MFNEIGRLVYFSGNLGLYKKMGIIFSSSEEFIEIYWINEEQKIKMGRFYVNALFEEGLMSYVY